MRALGATTGPPAPGRRAPFDRHVFSVHLLIVLVRFSGDSSETFAPSLLHSSSSILANPPRFPEDDDDWGAKHKPFDRHRRR
jgi:hypothetical protein